MDQNPPIFTNQSEECCCPSLNPRTMVTERVLSSFILNKVNYARILIGSHLSNIISLEDRRIDYVIFVTLFPKTSLTNLAIASCTTSFCSYRILTSSETEQTHGNMESIC